MTKVNETKLRSVLKGVTARIIEVVSDVIIMTLLGVNIHTSLAISILISAMCFVASYVNERFWNLTDFGRKTK